MADFPDDLMSICTQSLMAVEDNWNEPFLEGDSCYSSLSQGS